MTDKPCHLCQIKMIEHNTVILRRHGERFYCTFPDFVNIEINPMGAGFTVSQAVADLMRKDLDENGKSKHNLKNLALGLKIIS